MLLLLDQFLEQDLLRPRRGNAYLWGHLLSHAWVSDLQLLRLQNGLQVRAGPLSDRLAAK